MGEPKFTKGPWKVDPQATMTIVSEKGRGIASISYSQNFDFDKVFAENKANARLIAAAPELYKALGKLLQASVTTKGPTLGDIAEAEGILAKARGEA